tara:strand:+ start:12654 stop:13658 length:1005 start_codon:yes stop_codon:yes gene_type:complete
MDNRISTSDHIFIAGSNGMVGRATTKRLIDLGYGNKKHYGKLLTPKRSELDLSDYNKVEDWFKENKPSVVIFAAAKVGGIKANQMYPAEFMLDNLKIQNNVIELAYKYDVKRFLFLGSSCIYPKFAKQPIKEEYLLSNQLEKTNEWYAIAKIAGLKLCESLRIQYGFDAISLMPTNLYGKFDNYETNRSHVLPALIRKFTDAVKNKERVVYCWGDGSPLREFLNVDDLASAIVFVLENWDPSNKFSNNYGEDLYYLNVGSGEEISIYNLAHKIAKLTGFNGEIKWDGTQNNGTPRKKLDCTRIFNMGWKPTIMLDEGLNRTLKSFNEEFNQSKL